MHNDNRTTSVLPKSIFSVCLSFCPVFPSWKVSHILSRHVWLLVLVYRLCREYNFIKLIFYTFRFSTVKLVKFMKIGNNLERKERRTTGQLYEMHTHTKKILSEFMFFTVTFFFGTISLPFIILQVFRI